MLQIYPQKSVGIIPYKYVYFPLIPVLVIQGCLDWLQGTYNNCYFQRSHQET